MLSLLPEYDLDSVVDWIITAGYPDEFCISDSFDPLFIRRLFHAGFLVMSAYIDNVWYLLPKYHHTRSVLFFENLHVSRSTARKLDQYELRPFDSVSMMLEQCIHAHGDDWLTLPLQQALSSLELVPFWDIGSYTRCRDEGSRNSPCGCIAFGLYQDKELVAGEFGVVCGRVYTSYSGFYVESGAGTVQLCLTAQCLESRGFAFWDLGMPMDYKTKLGAQDIDRDHFTRLFRSAR
ncbi:MAG: leucyl-tRNA--protein transferase [Termitinemataceae bacterium]